MVHSTRHVLWTLAMVLAFVGGNSARSQEPPPPAADRADSPAARQLDWILRSINDRAVSDTQGRFSPRFLEQHTLDELVDRLTGLRDRFFNGAAVSVIFHEHEPRADAISCVIGNEQAERFLSLILAVDQATGRISLLSLVASFAPSDRPSNAPWNAAMGSFGRNNGGVWFGAYEVLMQQPGTPAADVRIRDIYEFGNRKPLAIASASRVYLLLALAQTTIAGNPPAADHLTSLVAEVAKDDAPAADALLAALTRPVVETALASLQQQPLLNIPFLSRAEVALLKSPTQGDVLQRFVRVDQAERAAMVAPGGLVSLHRVAFPFRRQGRPVAVETVGWFATSKEAAYAMARLALLERDPRVIAAGLPEAWRQPQRPPVPLPPAADAPPGEPIPPLELDPATWKDHVLIAGGEPGIYTLLLHLTSHDGRTYALVMTWNDVDRHLDQPRLHEMARRGVAMLARSLAPAPSTRP